MRSLVKQNYLFELQALDWDFDGASGTGGLAGYHWYPARYVPNVPGVLIGYFSESAETVLDPFCGSGTTLVEAVRQGRKGSGIDTNPVAALMTRAKLVEFQQDTWVAYCDLLRRRFESNLLQGSRQERAWLESVVPNYEENARWYHPETLHELAAIWIALSAEHGKYAVVAQAAFSAILRFACSQTKHWGWICDNVWPKEHVYRPASAMFFQKLVEYARSAEALVAREAASRSALSKSDVVLGPCASVLRNIPEQSVDLVVTSPPYFGMTDYVRSQRLTFLWFGWNLDEFRSAESGARYKRRRLTAYDDFLKEMEDSFSSIVRVLKPGKVCAVVIGESPNRQPYLEEFEKALLKAGLTIEMRLQRAVSKRRVMSPQLHNERIIIGRRRADS